MAQFAWEAEDGSVCITTCADGVDSQGEFEKLVGLGIIPKGAVPLHDPVLPRKRSQREKWRIQNGKIVIDPTVPDPPHPRKALLDAIDGASSLDEIKSLLKQVVTS